MVKKIILYFSAALSGAAVFYAYDATETIPKILILPDERKHVGLRNIRERLKAMVNGTLTIESTIGVGTRVLIEIPKET